MPQTGNIVNLGFTRRNNTKPRPYRKDMMPPEEPTSTDPLIQNIESLIDTSIKPTFMEMWERGHGDYAAFASDFLDVQLHDGQKRWLHTAAWADERLISAANRWGKASPNFEPILTPFGWKPIGNLLINDWVYSQDGTPTQVIGVYPQGIIHCYRFVFDDNSSVITSDEHLWTVGTSRERFRKTYTNHSGQKWDNETYGTRVVLTTKQILDKGGENPTPYNRISIPIVEPVNFPSQDVPIDPYMIGVLIGDGNLTNRSSVRFSTADAEIIESIEKQIPEGYRVYQSKSRKYDFSISRPAKDNLDNFVNYGENSVVESIRTLGLNGHRAEQKFIPKIYLWNDVATRIGVLRGLMDADGSIQPHSANVEFSTTSERLAKDVLFLIQSLGGKGKISKRITKYTYRGVKKEGQPSYRIDFRIPNINPFRLSRKANLWKEKGFTKDRILVRIEDAGYHNCTCIEVDNPTNLYVTKDFIVTHNTAASGVKALHDCFYQTRPPEYAELTNEYTFLNLSLTIEMSKIAWEYALKFGLSSKIFRRFILENEIKTAPFPTMAIGTPKSQRTNAFRSEYWARSSAKKAYYILGQKFDRINYDECARDPNGKVILDEVLRMRVADRNGQIDMPSTAAGKNWFYIECMEAKSDADGVEMFYTTGNAYENPYISHAKVKRNEKKMVKAWVEQNVHGGFADYANVFYRPQIEAMYTDVDYPICTDYTKLEGYIVDPNGKYIMAIDWALKRDATVIMVTRVDEGRWDGFKNSVGESVSYGDACPLMFCQGFTVKESGARYSWQELKNIATLIHRRYNYAPCLFDSTGLAGEMIYDDLKTMGMVDHEGYDFSGNNGQAKDHLILVGQQALQAKSFVFPLNDETRVLVEQLLLYSRDDKRLDTDYTFALCLLAERLRRASLPQSEILSLPLLFASGSRHFGGQHPFDMDRGSRYEVNVGAPVVEMGNGFVIVSNKGRVKAEELQA